MSWEISLLCSGRHPCYAVGDIPAMQQSACSLYLEDKQVIIIPHLLIMVSCYYSTFISAACLHVTTTTHGCGFIEIFNSQHSFHYNHATACCISVWFLIPGRHCPCWSSTTVFLKTLKGVSCQGKTPDCVIKEY